MSEWTTIAVGEIAEIFDGPHATPKKTTSGPWFLSISSLNQGRLELGESAHISEEDFQKWTRRVTPREGDVLFSYETRLGEAALMPGGLRACLGRRMALLRPRPGRVDSKFLLYAYLGPQFQDVIRQRTVRGATVDRIPLVELPSWPFNLPSPMTQQAIAALLGAIDDRIAINDRVAATSHELAVLYYKIGINAHNTIPLSSLVEPILGGTPDRSISSYWGPGNLWASAKDVANSRFGIITSTEEEITDLAVAETKAKPVCKGSVILSARGTVGAVARVGQPTSFNQSCYAFIPNLLPPTVLYLTVRSAVEQMLSVAHGTVFSTVTMKTFDHIHVPSAKGSELESLERRTAPLLDAIEARVRENQVLARLRDTLLPRLMSGEIRVRDAEKVVEEATLWEG